jgi:CRISPR-associated protein Csm4
MGTFLYRLQFKAPVHFGQAGIGLEEVRKYLPSDSITSALINAFAVLGEADRTVAALREEPAAFVLSSLFPFGRDPEASSETLYALPRPLMLPPLQDDAILGTLGKDLKRLHFVQPEDALRWISNVPLAEEDLKGMMERSQRLAGLWDIDKERGWWADELRPRVSLDRTSQNSAIWWCGVLHFAPGAGLYGLVTIADPKWSELLAGAFRLLGELGLGGERTYGMGTFAFSGFESVEQAWSLKVLPKTSRYLLLSRYYPNNAERSQLAAELEAWNFEETRGYIVSGRTATTLKRKRVRMLCEGSVARKPLGGTLVDVTPDNPSGLGLTHAVYRSGLGLWMPSGGMV